MTWPDAEFAIDQQLVASLLREQFPDLADLAVASVGEGFDNSVWRIGHELVARIPRRMQAVTNIENELRWLPVIAKDAPLPTPLPLLEGKPSEQFPWPWLIAPWYEGTPGHELAVATRSSGSAALGGFLRHLHQAAPTDAPFNPYRSVPIGDLDSIVKVRIETLKHDVDESWVQSMWKRLREDASSTPQRTWIHGDLHAGNIIYADNQLRAVIDFGDLCGGDPATDLAGGLLSFDRDGVRRFFDAYGTVNSAVLGRTLCWTFHFALLFIELGRTHKIFGAMGQLGLANIRTLHTPDRT